MNYITSGIGFIKVGKDDETFRYVDVMPLLQKKDGVIEPYLFSYNFMQAKDTMEYDLPIEGLNNSETLAIVRNSNPSYSKNKSLYVGNYFLPQIASSVSASKVNSLASSTRHEDIDGNMSFSIYLTMNPGETWMEIFRISKDSSDPYGEVKSNKMEPLLERQYVGKRDFMKIVIIGVTVEPETWNYSISLVNQISKPVKWVVDTREYDYTRVPNKRELQIRNSKLVSLTSEGNLQIGNRVINSQPMEIELDPLITLFSGYDDPF